MWICNAPELFVTVTHKRRWSTKRYVEWSWNTLLRLVADRPTPGPRTPSLIGHRCTLTSSDVLTPPQLHH